MSESKKFFLKYAFPCAHVLLETKAMNQETYDKLESDILKDNLPNRELIESFFPSAFRRIKQLANEMDIEDYWDMKVIKEYWYNNHNKVIDEREGNYSKFPDSFCDFCKVHIATVKEILPENFILIEYNNTMRLVSRDYTPNVKIGQKVRIHHAYAIEIVE